MANELIMPRGVRNNNPGNLRLSSTVWQGQKPLSPLSDLAFAEFTTPVMGLRALMKTLLTYHLKYGLDTVESIVNRYAPPHENATDHYIACVARAMGARRSDMIELRSKPVLIALAQAIVTHENGLPPKGRPRNWYPPALYEQAADLVEKEKNHA